MICVGVMLTETVRILPGHTVLPESVGTGVTLTVTDAVLLQPLVVPVQVYVVVTVGLAVTLAPDDADILPAGDQL